MSETELLKKIDELEKKNAALEETISTIELMEKSESISDFLNIRRSIHHLLSLINSISDETISVEGKIQEKDVRKVEEEKLDLERRIQDVVNKTNACCIREIQNEAFFGVSECELGLVITHYYGFDTRIIVPPVLYNKRVVKIGKKAFESIKCEAVILPDTILEIENEAFRQCISLREIELGTQIEKIGEWAFMWCKSLKTITLPETLKSIGRECFMNSGIEYVVLPGSLHTVPYGCFFNCNLKQVILKEGISVIDKYAFSSFKINNRDNYLKTIVFPKSIVSVDVEMLSYQKETIQTKMIFLGDKSKWFVDTSSRYRMSRMNHYLVYCALGSEILKSSVKLKFEVHPLSEYLQEL